MLQLGSFVFGITDLPATLDIQYKLKNTVQRLADGSRFLQEFGAEVDSISWKGTFLYDDAVGRAKQVKDMFLARRLVTFTCDVYTAQVVITDYKVSIHNVAEVDYDITLYINTPTGYVLRNTRLDSVISSVTAATNAATSTGIPSLPAQASAVTSAIQAAGLHLK